MSADKSTKIETRLAHAGRSPRDHHGVVNPPVYHASTILQPSLAAWEAAGKPGYDGYLYGRFGTPTTRSFETAIAELYGADDAVAVSSGLAAIAVAMTAHTKTGDHVLVTDSAYFPCRKFCETVLRKYGVAISYYDPTVGAGIADLIRPETSLIVTESPGSVTFEIQDIPAIVAAAHARGVKVMTDNTWATALYFNPLDHGVDVVVEAATKYISGHSDVMIGLVAGRGTDTPRLRATAGALGNCSGPDDLYLAQRGLRTMAVRIARNQANGLALARWLQTRPEVARVLHPALPDHPGHALWQRDFRGASGLFSIVLHPVEKPALAAFLDGLKLFGMGASWGGYESLIMPADPRALRSATSWDMPGQLLRIHAGLEDPGDLIADLESGFERLAQAGSRPHMSP
ncbi:MAG: cystathionine beta-lyase [Rhodospirillales bacterium]|nr:cystathionine beta-lyase [Rhodospirillales bacterium]